MQVKGEKEQLQRLSKRGIFPLDGESFDQLYSRASTLLKRDQQFSSFALSFEKQWGFWPDWACVKQSSQGLSFFEKGATFVDLTSEKQPAYIHIKKVNPTLQQEVLEHEMIHLVRSWLHSPRFEEPMAYMNAKARFRRYFGASFRRPLYTWIFLFLSAFPLVALFYSESIKLISTAYTLPVVYLLTCMSFSYYDHRILKACRKKLAQVMPLKKAKFVLITLDDKAINALKKCPENQLREWIDKKAGTSLLWHFIKEQFLN